MYNITVDEAVEGILDCEKELSTLRSKISFMFNLITNKKLKLSIRVSPLDFRFGIINMCNVKFGPVSIVLLWRNNEYTEWKGLGRVIYQKFPWFPCVYKYNSANSEVIGHA